MLGRESCEPRTTLAHRDGAGEMPALLGWVETILTPR
jgi:hypothetical protein